MPAKWSFADFLREFEIDARPPASPKLIAETEAKLGLKLPQSVRDCYLQADGGEAPRGRSRLTVIPLAETFRWEDVAGFASCHWGYFPFAENNDSDPISVCCKSPLAGYVVHVRHDDDARLLYRSLDGFIRAAIEYIRDEQFLDTHELPSDFAGPGRMDADRSIARELISSAHELGSHDCGNALRFACDLLADSDVEEIGGLLKLGDEYVCEHVERRLRQIPGPRAKQLLRSAASDYDAFVERSARTLKDAGIAVSEHNHYGRRTLRIDPGNIVLRLDAFFADRRTPDVQAYLLERAKALIALHLEEDAARVKDAKRD